MIGDAMIGGFALIATPAQYGVTGVQTFIVNHDGIVYQKDLGGSARTTRGRSKRFRQGYRVKRSVPRVDVNTSVRSESVTVLSPPRTLVYAPSNSIVGHAARVHASAGPAVRVCPDNVNTPPQTLQSACVKSRPSPNVNV